MIRTNTLLMTGVFLFMSAAAVTAAPVSSTVPQTNRSIILVSDAQDVVHDETNGTVVHSTSGACVRTKWMSANDICASAAAPEPAPRPAMTLSREERTVYFAFNKADLSPEMKQRLDTLAAKLKSERSVKGARIIGYADRIGDPAYNEKLSQKRAENAKEYLIAKGIINTSVADTRWLGATTPITDCPVKLARPKLIECLQGDRRVEVEIDYFPQEVVP